MLYMATIKNTSVAVFWAVMPSGLVGASMMFLRNAGNHMTPEFRRP
jgi:hypothetical protein